MLYSNVKNFIGGVTAALTMLAIVAGGLSACGQTSVVNDNQRVTATDVRMPNEFNWRYDDEARIWVLTDTTTGCQWIRYEGDGGLFPRRANCPSNDRSNESVFN